MSADAVVVTYESSRHLGACLAALPPETRVVVVDNASTDGSAKVAEELGASVVRNVSNRGFAAAANQGARLCRRDLVLFLNPDAVIARADLQVLIDAMERDPRLFAVGPRLRHPDGTSQQAWWPFPSPARTWLEAFGLHRLHGSHPPADGIVPFVVGACLLVRRTRFEALGGFDERFWLYGEEADLCYRARRLGWSVRFVAHATARHVGGASGAVTRRTTFEHFQRGAEHFIDKHHGRRALLVHRLGLLTGSMLRLLLLGPGQDPAKAARRQTRWAVSARLTGVLLRHPLRVHDREQQDPLVAGSSQ